jgi:hypothetical protein
MLVDWIAKGHITATIIGIAAFIYVVLVLIFFAYEVRKKQSNLLRQQAIAQCLGSHGHVGPENTCWYDKPVPKGILQ